MFNKKNKDGIYQTLISAMKPVSVGRRSFEYRRPVPWMIIET